MKFGIPLARAHPGLWPELTKQAEALGFESVWLPEHLVFPVAMSGSPHRGDAHPPVPPQTPIFDALNYLSFLAGQTETIRLGTYVYNIGLRHPFVSARAAATLDIVSGGRFDFGIGASWLREEWEAVGLDFDSRGPRVDEALQVCRALWSQPSVEYHGRFFEFGEVMFEPKPVQPGGPPVHVGGDGKAALRRVAQLGDGWLPMNHTVDRIPESVRILTGLWAEYGRSGTPQVTTSVPISSADDISRAADAGIDRLIVAPWQRTRDALEGIARFADQYFQKAGAAG
ncbi:LLM class F420-dependent oxidoreductase [Mycobacterium kyorinense]|uniref:LLM class F420-dependent oxidoreductase n=1 Tax=Mycobacterium kyorinense TaxID=487514 RepID=A0A1A2YTY0_9MYCO|nr:LLM class F420-dependent oxidoreductase [Mycobacterium kyorinense]OBI40702.1 LLM class F420-dependent oxidoreductase [Mycobacterium kyorinense]